MDVNLVVFCLTLVAIVAIVFGKDDIAKKAVTALAQRFEDTIKAAGHVVKRLAPKQPPHNTNPNEK